MFLPSSVTGHQRRCANHIYCIARPLDVVAGIFVCKNCLINLNNWTCALHQYSLRSEVKERILSFGWKIIKHSSCIACTALKNSVYVLSVRKSSNTVAMRNKGKHRKFISLCISSFDNYLFVWHKHNAFKTENYPNKICTALNIYAQTHALLLTIDEYRGEITY